MGGTGCPVALAFCGKREYTPQSLVTWQNQTIVVTKIPFGKLGN